MDGYKDFQGSVMKRYKIDPKKVIMKQKDKAIIVK